MSMPDFLIIGAPKCGTTSLHVALARHPGLFLSRIKEPKYFLTDGPPPSGGGPGDAATYAGYVWQREQYEALFDPAPQGVLLGESTTLYLRDHAAHVRIAETIPDARLIVVLRDPVDRAHSNWTHLRAAGLEPIGDFLEACSREAERAAAGWGPFWRYLDLGMYGRQLGHLCSVMPREQVLVLIYRDLREQPVPTLDRVTAFLGVEPGVVTDVPTANVTAQVSTSRRNGVLASVVRRAWHASHHSPRALQPALSAAATGLSRLLQREQQVRVPLTVEERRALVPHFAEDVALLERLTGMELARWRDPETQVSRRPLPIDRRFGTAYESIDRPLH